MRVQTAPEYATAAFIDNSHDRQLQVSAECIGEAADADLVVLEGMGRGIETNLYAKFTCESLKLAMIKHPEVAACLRGRLYDCVCQYDAGVSK